MKLPPGRGEGSSKIIMDDASAYDPATLVKKLNESTQQQSTLVDQLQSQCDGNDIRLLNKDDEISLLKAQLEAARAEVVSANNSRRKLAEENISLLAQVSRERGELSSHRKHCDWAIRYLQLGHKRFYANLEVFRQSILTMYEDKERRLRKLSLEYDEELYPQLVSTIAERR